MLIVRYILFWLSLSQQRGFIRGRSSRKKDAAGGVCLHGHFSHAKIADDCRPWRYRLKVRTEPSQGSNPGSSPGIATNLSTFLDSPTMQAARRNEFCRPGNARFKSLRLLYVAGFNSLFLEILLVVFLGPIKFRSRSDFGHDRPLEDSFLDEDIL
jgi:hypothetical protein